jgi:SAM-dependent methyltransferase
MLREARGMARHEQLDEVLTFQDGSVEVLPFPERGFDCTLSCTMLEEVDADRTIAELVRVTTPGGRVGIIVWALDIPWWVNLPLETPLKTTLEAPSRLGAGVRGCQPLPTTPGHGIGRGPDISTMGELHRRELSADAMEASSS